MAVVPSNTLPRATPLSPAQHVIRHLRLAVPVMIARLGMILMISVDTVMVGRVGAEELAYYAISLAPHMTLLVVGIGLTIGTMILTAQADGAGRPEDCGAIWHTALWVGGALGLVGALGLLPAEPLLLLLGQSDQVAAGGGRALVMFAAGLPAIMMFIVTSFFLEGINRPGPGVVVALVANLANAALNWVLISGHLGAPEMGAAGAALATTVTRWLMFFWLAGHVLLMADGDRYGVRSAAVGRLALAGKFLRLGTPLAIITGLETSCFTAVTTFAGWLGPVPLASYQVAFNVITFVFMLSVGVSTATSVRVANAVGRRDPRGLVAAGWTGIGLVLVITLAMAVAIRVFNDTIAAIYIGEAAVLAIAAPALVLTALVVVVDGLQAVAMGALRGTADVWLPMLACAVAYWGVAVPAAYGFGIALQGGVVGLLWGVFAGLLLAFVLLAWRFAVVARAALRGVEKR